MKKMMSGKQVVELLLALGDGDSVVIEGKEWASYEEHGFEVEDLRSGGVRRVDRADVKRQVSMSKHYEVVR
jgi:hypothetical protein